MKFSALLVLLFFGSALGAHAAFGVKCPAGRWAGVSYAPPLDGGEFQHMADGVELPATIYVIDAATMSAAMLDGKQEISATILHAFSDKYVIIGYTYNNVHYTDTIYMDGNVISMYTKYFFRPTASIFQQKCLIVPR